MNEIIEPSTLSNNKSIAMTKIKINRIKGNTHTPKDLNEVLQDPSEEVSIYEKEPLNTNDVVDIGDLMATLNLKTLLKKKAKGFLSVLREIAQNTIAHSLGKHPTLSIQQNNKEHCLKIKSSNYFNGGEKNKEKLIKKFDEINNLSLKEIKTKYKEELNNGKMEEGKLFSGGGLGLLKIARRVKELIKGKVFNYKITEETDDNNKKIYKLEIITKFPLPKAT